MSARFPIVVSVAATFFAGLPACDCGTTPLGSPPGRVAGVACDIDTGEPVAVGTQVQIEADGELLTATVGDAGAFVFGTVPAGDVVVLLPVDRRQDATVSSDRTVDVVDTACRDISLEHPGSVSGRVCNGHVGNVVAGADVVLVLPDGTQLTTTTDDDGNFTIDPVPQGEHALSIRGDGYSKSVLVTVGADEVVVLDVGDACAIPSPGEIGGVRGLVCAADFGGLVDASVSITLPGGEVIEVTTDNEGRFDLTGVPAGEHTLLIQKGSFRAEQTVVITAGEVLELDEEECALEPEDIRIAFVRGSTNDHMRDVLTTLGIDDGQIDSFGAEWAESLLSGDQAITGYDVLFLSCRSDEDDLRANPAMASALRDYIEAGGSVYASDQAYGIIEFLFPDKIDFEGDDTERNAANKGNSVDDLDANIVDFNMASSFGSNSATLGYPLRTWSVMRSVANDVDVYAKANAPLIGGGRVNNAPQIVGFDHGQGRVIYSSFHQEPGVHPDQLRMLQILMFEL